ncbi:hypothetical protein BH09MYX1_BH09MYX1_62510 [soil metagenome]
MRRALLFGFALTLAAVGACRSVPEHPANLDGVKIPNVGSPGITADAGTDGTVPLGTFATVPNTRGLTLFGGYLYISSIGAGASTGYLARVPAAGGAMETLAENLTEPWAIAANDTFIGFTTASSATGGGGVYDFLLGDTSVTTLTPAVSGAYGFVMDASAVYYTEGTGTLGVERRSLTTTAVDRIVTSSVLATGNALLISGQDLFVAASNGIVYRAPVLGGVLEPLDFPLAGSIADIALDTTTVYATVDLPSPNGAIMAFPKLGGAGKVLVSGLDRPARIAVDGSRVIYTNPTTGTVEAVSTAGGTPVTLATGLDAPYALAVGDAVYVGTTTAVFRVAK